MLEGCSVTGSPPPVSACPQLDREIHALHVLARTGEIPVEVAERQLNSYLLAVGAPLPGVPPRLLVLPIADAPHHSLLPDLGHVIHRILAQNPLPGSLSGVLEQCLPSLRHAPSPVTYEDSQEALLNLALALLLGLYPGGSVKKPCFEARARLFARVHGLLTAPPELQTAFCRANAAVVHLACMEYVARVMPAHMPSQAAFVHQRDPSTAVYFRRIPALCDELRQALDSPDPPGWPQIQACASAAVERVTRLKKSGGSLQPREPFFAPDPALLRRRADLAAHWSVPRLQGCPSPDEFRLLGHGLGLHGRLLWHIQREVQVRLVALPCETLLSPGPPQVFRLPDNLRRLQEAALARAGTGCARQTFLRTRHFLCQHCALQHKSSAPPKLRLDTIGQTLICSVCSGTDVLSIDMVGRILRHKRQSFLLCPGCVRIRPYQDGGELQAWSLDGCRHAEQSRPSKPAPARARPVCPACTEPANQQRIERVDHLTGELHQFSFCQRHAPRPDELARCQNARQLSAQFCPDD